MAPSAGSLDTVPAPPSHRRPTSAINDNAVALIERCGQTRIAVAARNDLGIRPDIEADLSERVAVFLCSAAGEENSRAINFLRKFGKDGMQTLGRGEPKVRWRQFSVFENGPLRAGVNAPGYSFNEHPGGFRSAAFNPQDALTPFHDSSL